ncbi:hypothetical protein BDV09DRAFT_79846 [Aspergillus tetrazonus]
MSVLFRILHPMITCHTAIISCHSEKVICDLLFHTVHSIIISFHVMSFVEMCQQVGSSRVKYKS